MAKIFSSRSFRNAVRRALHEEDAGLRAFFEADQERAPYCSNASPSFLPSFARNRPPIGSALPGKPGLRSVSASGSILVAPWDHAAPTPPGRLRLEIYPGMACGTGRHPATQLCLEAIERYVQPGARVLDVGSGSGILSDAALLMGAGCVIGCDVDPDAVRIARERVTAPMFVGSADAARSQWADVIVANIDAATWSASRPELERVRKPGSTLILSGFPEGNAPEGFSPAEILSLEGWRCFIC